MSTGENINANGAVLTQALVRMGFFKFPQTVSVWVNPQQWSEIAPMQMMDGYPFRAIESDSVPAGEIEYRGASGELLGRIVNLGT